jgi:glycerophosphoryl diester phosphodiesterase
MFCGNLPMLAMLVVLAGSCAVPAKSPQDATLARMRSGHVQVVAHRGASRACPENTIAALQYAVQQGADVVEFDVYQTRDGHWVCMHDVTCDRTTNARDVFGRQKVRIDQLTLAEVQRLDAGKWFAPEFAGERVPTLQQALQAIAPAMPMIERKAGDAQHLVAELQRLDVVDDVIVQSFDWDWLVEVAAAEPRLLLAALGGDEPTPDRLRDIDRTGARIVHWNHSRVTRAMADAVHASGRLLCIYTVDAEVAFYGAVAIGCDLITTNRPEHYVAERAVGHFTPLRR